MLELMRLRSSSMSDAGDEVKVDTAAEVEAVVADAPKGKMTVEEALQVRYNE